MEKSLRTAKIEELLQTYKDYKKLLKSVPDKNEAIKSELAWIKIFIEDLKWLLDDETY